jgi:hypothetical protein
VAVAAAAAAAAAVVESRWIPLSVASRV